MRIKFWGVRGSIPSPGRKGFSTAKYGGNTPCVELRMQDNTILVIDAGSGLRLMGNELAGLDFEGKKKINSTEFGTGKGEINVLFSHYHWDHIQGLPFFKPLYIKGNKINFFGSNTEQKLLAQMKTPFFPIDFNFTGATKTYREIRDGDKIKIGNCTVSITELNHPDRVFGFRMEEGKSVFTYASDVENNVSNREKLLEFARNSDVLVYDCQYTFMEYDPRYHGKEGEGKKDWGHSIIQEGVRIAAEAGVKTMVSFHHNPESSDRKIDDILKFARRFKKEYGKELEIIGAYEGLEIEI